MLTKKFNLLAFQHIENNNKNNWVICYLHYVLEISTFDADWSMSAAMELDV